MSATSLKKARFLKKQHDQTEERRNVFAERMNSFSATTFQQNVLNTMFVQILTHLSRVLIEFCAFE